MRVGVGMLICTAVLLGCKAGDSGTIKTCQPGAAAVCSCGATSAMKMCLADGSGFTACPCPGGLAGSAAGAGGTIAGTMSGGAGGAPTLPGSGGASVALSGRPSTNGASGMLAQAAGRGGSSGMAAGLAGKSGSSGGSAGGAAGTAGDISGLGTAELDMLRQTCVDEINMYRATVSGLMPLSRANATQEMCSDTGAVYDGTNNAAHGYAKMSPLSTCRGTTGLGSEDTCPGWGVGGFTGNATVADALKNCLKSMWAEGDPPNGRQACTADLNGCFQMHGHYLNMSDPGVKVVACSFFKMSNGSYWMNQDFASR